MSLLQLPNELLLNVASFFFYECDINVLMQTSRPLYYPLNTYLYRHSIRFGEGSALEWAFANGHTPTARRMLEAGALLSDHLHECWHPMTVAWVFGYDIAVKPLRQGIEPDSTQGEQKIDHSVSALTENKESILQILFASGLSRLESRAMRHLGMDDEIVNFLTEKSVIDGDLRMVKFLVDRFPGVLDEKSYNHDRTPILEAANQGHMKMVRFLLSAGANPHITASAGQTPLYYAAKHGDIDVVKLLLDYGALPDPPIMNDVFCWRSLETILRAAGNKHVTVVELLLQHIDVEAKMTGADTEDRDILMVVAAMYGYTTIIQRILEKGSHGDTKPWGSRTFLHEKSCCNNRPISWATDRNQKDVVAMLLDHGASPYGGRKDTVLTRAIRKGFPELVELVLDRNVDFTHPCYAILHTSTPCSLGICALHCATYSPQLFQLLLDRGALVPGNPGDFSTLMAVALSSGNVAIVQTLLDKAVPLEVHGAVQTEALLRYAARGGIEMLSFLSTHHGVVITNPANAFVKDMLWDALRGNNSAVVDYLIDQGCDPSSIWNGEPQSEKVPSTNNPETPATTTTTTVDILLHHAANKNPILNPRNWDMLSEENQLKHVQLLLDKGANTHPDSSTWVKDALLLSAGEQYWRVVDLLLQSISACASLEELQRFGNSLPG